MALLQRKRRILPILIPIILVMIFLSLTGKEVRRARWYEEAFWNLITPPQKFITFVCTAMGDVWDHYISLVGLKRDADTMKSQIADLRRDLIRSKEIDAENQRLKSLLNYKESLPYEAKMARVIANDPRTEFKSITIDIGYDDGVLPLMPVVGADGLVGKVGKTFAKSSQVLLIIDPNSSVDSMVQRSRARGLIIGTADKTKLRPGNYLTRLEYLRRVSDIRDGDVLVTSGFDGIFPSGIPIGTVAETSASRYGIFQEANVVPFENMAELQEVMVLLKSEERGARDEGRKTEEVSSVVNGPSSIGN